MSIPDPTFDSDGYPTDEWLNAIGTSPFSPAELIGRLRDAWRYEPPMVEGPRPDPWDNLIYTVTMVTHGWSGNESIRSALDKTLFWCAFWVRSERGGLNVFEVPADQWEIELPVLPQPDSPDRRIEAAIRFLNDPDVQPDRDALLRILEGN